MNHLEGIVHKYYRDNIDTDVIVPGQYLKIHDHRELAKHAMEGLDPDFFKKVSDGDFLLCGRNFGCGSSREHAPIALANCGIKAIIAPSFARIFYRNAVDGGYLLPIEVDEETCRQVENGNRIIVDTLNSKLVNITQGRKAYDIKPFPKIIARIIEAGGLINLDPQKLLDT
ncbi:MAG: 3-isopropylmalate dehydratase small subunit [Nitrososphaeraceae archaeon]